ncbi:PadR family transcriptional regulator [Spiroplasma endosymbiont of Amphibalanus improvisus]|uniref:PadR family transcriptional regulator n=1 Tax=Spiroplasma endosymbiont of Amphibalanus improvisus TaxID=3066327 RepID=UPI00313E18D2
MKKGIIELIILKCLKNKDMYAYEINKIINKTIDTNESTVYVNLKKLVENKYLIMYQKNSLVEINRKYYQITSLGMQRLNSLLEEWNNFYLTVNQLLDNIL